MVQKGSDSRICSRIDRVLGNDNWKGMFPAVVSQYLNPSLSDHCPILVNYGEEGDLGGRPFRFMNYMASHENLEAIA